MFGMIGNIVKSLLGGNSTEKIEAIKGLAETIVSNKEASKKHPEKAFSNAEDEIIALAMIEAAKADGVITAEEMSELSKVLEAEGEGESNEMTEYLMDVLQQPSDMDRIIKLARENRELAIKAYSSAIMLIHNPNEAERKYLDTLAKALGITPNIKKIIETNI